MSPEAWEGLQYFKRAELLCKCCGSEDMDPTFMFKLDLARHAFGKPIRVTSGWRCKKHNMEISGSPTSSHLMGRAADLDDKKDPIYRGQLQRALLAAGFTQFEFSRDGHLHVMNDTTKPSPFVGVEP